MKSPTRHAVLAAANRLTDRDREVLSLVARHQVLTTHQITRAVFGNPRVTRRRIQVLTELGLLDCFRPPLVLGSSPKHCVVTPFGLLAVDGDSEQGRVDAPLRAVGVERIAFRPDLKHLVGVNDLFCSLLEVARESESSSLDMWWSEHMCVKTWGSFVRPDGFGRWREGSRTVDFFLEFDTGSEHGPQVVAKLAGYEAAASATGIFTPVLLWFHSSRREEALRSRLARSSTAVPMATASEDPGVACAADAVWRPVGVESRSRRRLVELADPAVFTRPGTR